ncbi:MAG: hypothetical protein ABJB05_01070 [Parafilimonas sp.]
MKKWLLLIIAFLVICIVCIYIFIPSTIAISDIVTAKATRDGTYRVLTATSEWRKWWVYETRNANNIKVADGKFIYNGYTYKLQEPGYNSMLVSIGKDDNNLSSNISILQLETDSIVIMWQSSLQTTNNPFEKIHQYFAAVDVKKNMTEILEHLKVFVEKDENIYGIKIVKGTVKDTSLITTKQMFAIQPTMNDVYRMIGILKDYAHKNNCRQTDVPMLNILHDSDKYRVMVGLPINKEVPASSTVSYVKMTNGNFMVTQVQGGSATVQNALNELQLYFSDYNKTSMAITFQYLVTDRIEQTDTTKWITKVYAPVL